MDIFKKVLAFLLVFLLIIPLSSLFVSADEGVLNGISEKSACLIEAESGRVLYRKNASKRMPMASTTKIMTAIVALESGIALDTKIRIPKEAVGIEGSSVYLKQDESVSFEMLLYALLLSSANDAAVAIACTVSDSVESFVDLMNKKARELGLVETCFTNPHGLYDESHYTTATELAKIMAYAMKNPDFVKITSCKQIAFKRDGGTSFLLSNHNRLLKTYDGVIGGKTGFTKKSGRCLVSCAEREGLRLIAVTLCAPDDWNDHKELYDFGFYSYERVCFEPVSFTLPVISGTKNEVLVTSSAFSSVLPRKRGDITVRINAPTHLFADIKEGERIGEIVYFCNGKAFATSPLYAKEHIPRIKYKFNLFDWLTDLFKGLFN